MPNAAGAVALLLWRGRRGLHVEHLLLLVGQDLKLLVESTRRDLRRLLLAHARRAVADVPRHLLVGEALLHAVVQYLRELGVRLVDHRVARLLDGAALAPALAVVRLARQEQLAVLL